MRQFLGVALGKILLLQLSRFISSSREKAYSDIKDEHYKITMYPISGVYISVRKEVT